MTTTKPSPYDLWRQSADEFPDDQAGRRIRYVALMREYGHLRPTLPGEDPSPLCGWRPRQGTAMTHAARVADVNARIAREGRCVMHNPEVNIPARYIMRVPIGNELPLCEDCCIWWRADAVMRPEDVMTQPVWIRDIDGERQP